MCVSTYKYVGDHGFGARRAYACVYVCCVLYVCVGIHVFAMCVRMYSARACVCVHANVSVCLCAYVYVCVSIVRACSCMCACESLCIKTSARYVCVRVCVSSYAHAFH